MKLLTKKHKILVVKPKDITPLRVPMCTLKGAKNNWLKVEWSGGLF
jgi:hypothetical protein